MMQMQQGHDRLVLTASARLVHLHHGRVPNGTDDDDASAYP